MSDQNMNQGNNQPAGDGFGAAPVVDPTTPPTPPPPGQPTPPQFAGMPPLPVHHHNGGLVGGVILIALGVIFLFQTFTGHSLHNWWALFILIPAVGAFTNAYRDYSQYNGQFRGAARGSLFAGIILTLVACIFLFGLSWGLILPVILIAVGVSLLFKVI